MRPAAILTDIEGTTTRIAFVRDVLFPYARTRLPALVEHAATRADIAPLLAEVARIAPGTPPLAALLAWMDANAKVTPLKTLQGIIWQEGYRTGALQAHLYPDVAPALRRWHEAGIGLHVYSSGSVPAQRLLFGHSEQGDLTPLFTGFYDTATGPKQASSSYTAIVQATPHPPGRVLFLSDIEAELDAAAAAGLRTCQLVRPQDDTRPAPGHAKAETFDQVEDLWGR